MGRMHLLRGMVWLPLLPVMAGCQSQRMVRQHLIFDMAVADLYKKHVLHNLAMRDQGDVIVQMTHNAFAPEWDPHAKPGRALEWKGQVARANSPAELTRRRMPVFPITERPIDDTLGLEHPFCNLCHASQG